MKVVISFHFVGVMRLGIASLVCFLIGKKNVMALTLLQLKLTKLKEN